MVVAVERNTMKRIPTALSSVLLSVAVLTAGCGSDDVEVKTDDGSVKVSRDGEEVTIEGQDGQAVVGGGSLPEDYPKDDVPVVDGKVTSGVSVDQGTRGWSVTLEVDGDPSAVESEAKQLLTAKGFKHTMTSNAGGVRYTAFENSTYRVLLNGVGDAAPYIVTYTVEKVD